MLGMAPLCSWHRCPECADIITHQCPKAPWDPSFLPAWSSLAISAWHLQWIPVSLPLPCPCVVDLPVTTASNLFPYRFLHQTQSLPASQHKVLGLLSICLAWKQQQRVRETYLFINHKMNHLELAMKVMGRWRMTDSEQVAEGQAGHIFDGDEMGWQTSISSWLWVRIHSPAGKPKPVLAVEGQWGGELSCRAILQGWSHDVTRIADGPSLLWQEDEVITRLSNVPIMGCKLI